MKYLISLFGLLCLSLTQGIYAQQGEQFPAAKSTCGPWVTALGENGFTVVWKTNVPSAAWVEIAPDDGSNFYACPRPKFYQSSHGRRPVGTLHQIPVTGLDKGTTYRFRIYHQAMLLDNGNKRVVMGDAYGGSIPNGPGNRITTLDPAKEELKFAVFNDIHADDSLMRDLGRNLRKQDLDFVIFNGDMLSQIEDPAQMEDGYLRSAAELYGDVVPIFALRGNHEYRGSSSYAFPDYFPTDNGKTYYTVRQGPAYMIFLDCGEDKPDDDIRFYGLSLTDRLREEQAVWLEQVTASAEFREAPVKIVVIHMPPADTWWGNREIERLFVPVLNRAGIDLMICGHWHRHRYLEPDGVHNFPIIANSNTERGDFTVTRQGIKYSFADRHGKVIKEYNIKK